MDHDVKTISMGEEFKICPTCGYTDGFHSMFRREGEVIRWLHICPSCHDVFDIGLTAG